jgi:rhodanese-related sulfurtransferase
MAQAHSPGFLKITNEAKSQVKECTVADVKGRLDRGEKLLLIDVREESEFATDHAAGAMHLSKGVIERDIETRVPDHDAEIVLYCGGGFRSALVAVNLQKMGYTRVISMDGGIRAWRDAKLPLEK